jgi:hypothetical protein
MEGIDRLAQLRLPFAELLGIRYAAATKDRVTAECRGQARPSSRHRAEKTNVTTS